MNQTSINGPERVFMTASDVHALADQVRGTNRTMRNQESLQHDLRLAAKAITICGLPLRRSGRCCATAPLAIKSSATNVDLGLLPHD
jgi:hypothetical protein